MSVDFAGGRVKVFTPDATNGQLVVDGAGPIINELFRVRWLTGGTGARRGRRTTGRADDPSGSGCRDH